MNELSVVDDVLKLLKEKIDGDVYVIKHTDEKQFYVLYTFALNGTYVTFTVDEIQDDISVYGLYEFVFKIMSIYNILRGYRK